MVCGILGRDEGDVFIEGQPLDSEPDRSQGRDRVRASGSRHLPGSQRPREPDVLRPAVRDGGLGAAQPRRRAARASSTSRTGPGSEPSHYSGGMKRRLNIAIGLLHRPRLLDPRRAHGRGRPAEPERDPGQRRGARGRGDGHPLHDPLHGGGGAALRPRRDHRRGPDHRRGHAAASSSPWSVGSTGSSLVATGDLTAGRSRRPRARPAFARRPPPTAGSTCSSSKHEPPAAAARGGLDTTA